MAQLHKDAEKYTEAVTKPSTDEEEKSSGISGSTDQELDASDVELILEGPAPKSTPKAQRPKKSAKGFKVSATAPQGIRASIIETYPPARVAPLIPEHIVEEVIKEGVRMLVIKCKVDFTLIRFHVIKGEETLHMEPKVAFCARNPGFIKKWRKKMHKEAKFVLSTSPPKFLRSNPITLDSEDNSDIEKSGDKGAEVMDVERSNEEQKEGSADDTYGHKSEGSKSSYQDCEVEGANVPENTEKVSPENAMGTKASDSPRSIQTSSQRSRAKISEPNQKEKAKARPTEKDTEANEAREKGRKAISRGTDSSAKRRTAEKQKALLRPKGKRSSSTNDKNRLDTNDATPAKSFSAIKTKKVTETQGSPEQATNNITTTQPNLTTTGATDLRRRWDPRLTVPTKLSPPAMSPGRKKIATTTGLSPAKQLPNRPIQANPPFSSPASAEKSNPEKKCTPSPMSKAGDHPSLASEDRDRQQGEPKEQMQNPPPFPYPFMYPYFPSFPFPPPPPSTPSVVGEPQIPYPFSPYAPHTWQPPGTTQLPFWWFPPQTPSPAQASENLSSRPSPPPSPSVRSTAPIASSSAGSESLAGTGASIFSKKRKGESLPLPADSTLFLLLP